MEFHFAVARITAAQLCRAAGIERCSRAALDALTDVLVRYLQFLGEAALSAAEDANKIEVEFDDAVRALTVCSTLQTRVPDDDATDIAEFLSWLNGPALKRALQAAKPPRQVLSSLASVLPPAGTPALGSLAPDTDSTTDWLRATLGQQTLIGQGGKFKGTEFGSQAPVEADIAGGPSSIAAFFESKKSA